METKDPALTKTPINRSDAHADDTYARTVDNAAAHDNAEKGTETFQETAIGTRYASDDVEHGNHRHEDIHHDSYNVMSTDDSIENHTTINKGTDTFQESVIGSEHVNDGDNPARQPDRRDQEGNAFDEGINEHTTIDESAKSEGINNLNRYANIDNAQSRVLNPDEKDFQSTLSK